MEKLVCAGHIKLWVTSKNLECLDLSLPAQLMTLQKQESLSYHSSVSQIKTYSL